MRERGWNRIPRRLLRRVTEPRERTQTQALVAEPRNEQSAGKASEPTSAQPTRLSRRSGRVFCGVVNLLLAITASL